MISEHLINIARAAEEVTHATADPSIAGMFGLSWKLFIAQLINFGIVVFVLWKWVFTPVTNALQKRTEKIEKSLQDATNIDNEKQKLEESKKEIMAEARKEAAGIVTLAKDEAEKVKAGILQDAKGEQVKIIEQTKKHLEQETAKAIQSVKQEVAGLVVTATEKILKEKLDDKKDKELIEESLKSIK